jgi:hypothetical protein
MGWFDLFQAPVEPRNAPTGSEAAPMQGKKRAQFSGGFDRVLWAAEF